MRYKYLTLILIVGVLLGDSAANVLSGESPDLRLVPYPKQVERKSGTFTLPNKLTAQLAKNATTANTTSQLRIDRPFCECGNFMLDLFQQPLTTGTA